MGRKRERFDIKITKYLKTFLTHWKNDSIEHYGNKCLISGDDCEVIHHLIPANKIMKETFEITNIKRRKHINEYEPEELDILREKFVELNYAYGYGVPLTDSIHKEFHSYYGLNSNEQDFLDYRYHKQNNISLDETKRKERVDQYIYKEIRVYKTEIDKVVLNLERFTDAKVMLWLLIFSKFLKDSEGCFYAPKESISSYSGVSHRTVHKSVNELYSLGLLEIVMRNSRDFTLHNGKLIKMPNIYRVNFDKVYENEDSILIHSMSEVPAFESIILNFYSLNELKKLYKRRGYERYRDYYLEYILPNLNA